MLISSLNLCILQCTSLQQPAPGGHFEELKFEIAACAEYDGVVYFFSAVIDEKVYGCFLMHFTNILIL